MDLLRFLQSAEAFDVEEFLGRVAARDGGTPVQAGGHARAVLATSRRTWRRSTASATGFPPDYRYLFA